VWSADGILGTIDDDPQIAASSPCIDAGLNAAIPAGTNLDLLGQPRVVDDPFVVDTGVGLPPLVDIGAVEYHGSVVPAASTWVLLCFAGALALSGAGIVYRRRYRFA
jgi:hypothetical protein